MSAQEVEMAGLVGNQTQNAEDTHDLETDDGDKDLSQQEMQVPTNYFEHEASGRSCAEEHNI